ncbi:hypothetical protein AAFC00_005911 [Neodothiora populina]|uniref:RNA polymerase II degradation factor 1 n=1 Tax=Neodothiora populina TaxID=2781224 RepID=A0ABR3P6J9_9PEZI
MSEIDARTTPSSRGRSSTRGGRGGHTRGGPRSVAHRSTNGTSKDVQIEEPLDEQGELGDMKKKYASELAMVRDVFPDWTDFDLVFALEEADGDIEATIERIVAGNVSQFSDVKKPKDRSRSKAKDAPATTGTDQFSTPVRGGRGRGGYESVRGGRGRGGADRGRGGFRGARGGHAPTDAAAAKDSSGISVPTTESTAWDTPAPATTAASSTTAPTNAWESSAPATSTPTNPWNINATAPAAAAATETPTTTETPATTTTTADHTNEQGAWGSVVTAESTPAAASEATKSTLIPDGGAKKTWASMFAKPKPAPVPVVPKQPVVPPPKPAELAKQEEVPAPQEPVAAPAAPVEETQQAEPQAQAPKEEEPTEPVAPAVQVETPVEPAEEPTKPNTVQDASSLAPSHIPLTEDNLENLPDVSHPPATLTAASTAGSMDPRVITPQLPIGRPPAGGFQTSAYRAAATPGRSASYQRRVLEQQEAVVMPGHNAVDRAAVQFGSLGLNGDAVNLDVDDEREEPETRTQPQQSPPSQPRASLPPAPRQQALSHETSIQENVPTPRQAPGLPPPSQQPFAQQDAPGLSSLPQEASQPGQSYSPYARYGQQPEPVAQKPFDPFSHQAPSTAFDQYTSQPSAQQQQQQQQQQGFGAFSSAPSDYSHYYTADQQRNAYQNYYGSAYGQQTSQSQDASGLQQRSSSGFGSAPGDSSFPSAQGPQQSQSRYGDAPGSGHNTPNPSMSGQQQAAAPAHQMHQQPQHQTGYAGYPYGHPYYNSPYHAAYQNQFGFTGQVGYGGAPFGGKGAVYGQPQGYGMNPPSTYESSPATVGGFGQTSMASRDSALGSGLGDYGRSSAQPSQLSSGGFSGMTEPFGRGQSGFQGQSQGYGQQQTMQQSAATDDLKPFGDAKTGGPSPALGQPGRPESATNSVGGQTAPSSALPPPQSHQQGFGAYPGFGSQGSQYALGGLGGSGHQQGAYGGYSGFGNTYGNAYARGGWGGNYH